MEGTQFIVDITAVMIVVGISALLLPRLRYPPVIGYLLGGVVIGTFSLVHNQDSVRFFADLGIIMLMFYLGLEFNLRRLRRIGLFSLVAGTIEIIIMIAIGYYLGLLLGWGHMESILLGAVMAVSSTALIAKMLIDTGKITTEHGEAVVGILIIEDFFVVLVLTMISPLTTDMAMDPLALVEIVVRILLLVSISLSLGLMIIPRAVDRISHSFPREAVLLASLGLCFFMVLISLAMELSVAVGAFIMGIIISQSKSVGMVSAQIRPVSTLFIAIFFVSMGMLIDPTMVVEGALQGVIIALVFMVGTLVAVSFATYVANKPAGTSLKAGLSMITMGEFSIIISKIGLDNGLLDTRFYSVVLTAVLITMLIYPLLVSRMQGVVDLFKGILPMSIKESLMAIEEIREGARKRMTASSLRAKQMKQEMKGIFVDVMIILVVIVGARIFLIVGEGLELEWIGSVWVSAGVVVAVLALSLPPLISIIRHLNGLMFLLTLCTEESGVCRFRERGSVLNIIIELNSVFIGTVLLFLLLPLIPASSHLSAPLLLASLIIAGMVALLAWRVVRAAHRRFAEAIVRGFREEE